MVWIGLCETSPLSHSCFAWHDDAVSSHSSPAHSVSPWETWRSADWMSCLSISPNQLWAVSQMTRATYRFIALCEQALWSYYWGSHDSIASFLALVMSGPSPGSIPVIPDDGHASMLIWKKNIPVPSLQTPRRPEKNGTKEHIDESVVSGEILPRLLLKGQRATINARSMVWPWGPQSDVRLWDDWLCLRAQSRYSVTYIWPVSSSTYALHRSWLCISSSYVCTLFQKTMFCC